MFKFNRKTEYGLIALRFLAERGPVAVSAREIADAYRLPYPLLSKVMQTLQQKGLLQSVQGTRGGYRLVREPQTISVGLLVEIFEGPHGLTNCLGAETLSCALNDICNVRGLFASLQERIHGLLYQTNLTDVPVPAVRDKINYGKTATGTVSDGKPHLS